MSYNNRVKTNTAAPNMGSLLKDVTLPADAEDTISSVSWSPVANHLAAASWDGKVRVYDVAANGSARGAAVLSVDGPVFDCDWAKDGTMVLAGGADRKTHLLHVSTGQQMTVGAHDAPIRGVRFVDVPGSNAPIIATGSWDRTVKFWDGRQQTPLATLACAERVYSMDAKARLLVIATAERHIHLVDLQNPTVFLRTVESPIKHQTKAVAAFPDGKGWGTASIEGRCGINALDEQDTSKTNFTFRCHRENPQPQPGNNKQQRNTNTITKVYSVNSVQFHPTRPMTFTTAGSDGTFSFWDRVARTRLRGYPSAAGDGNAITATAFSHDGGFFAYAVGYDWSRGHAGNSPQVRTGLVLHPVSEEDAKPKGR
ncbi:Uu.00g004120.m01.CDS01 [Anthostomella pinea]|uniref:Uu.00g004120.m01.CDS01 n=1 Tax=Anthostomella pinea TaxID=933095 RepID=A0AAI8VKL5_9PEZI|nr:Uu.00g004120.m01.CDS01 [Anthostomella pinea]